MKKCRFLLLLTMLLVSIGSFAQTTVEFVAGTDKGSNSKWGFWGAPVSDNVTKAGVTMSSTNAQFAADKYTVKNTSLGDKELSFSADKKILRVEFVDGEDLGNLSADGFKADAAKWEGSATSVKFTVKGQAKYLKAIVTIQNQLPTTLTFNQIPAKVYMGDAYTFAATLKAGNDNHVVGGKTINYTSSDAEVATVDGSGQLTLHKFGTTTIKASFAGDNEYEAAEAQYDLNVVKRPTTLAFDQTMVVNYLELDKKYNSVAMLKFGDNELTGFALTYESSNTDVASVDGAGVITPKAVGTTTITAKFAGNDEYEESEAQLTFNVVDGKNIFHETFDNMDGEGGNDGNFSLTGSMFGNLGSNLSKCDNDGWTTLVGSNGKADKCVRIEMSSSITTPAISGLSGDAFLMFRAAQNRNAGTSINLSISGGGELEEKSVSLEKAFDDYTILVRNATPQTKITFSCSAAGCFYLDDVKIERAIVLNENADNREALADNQLDKVNVAFKRSLSKDYWNTICLPFDIKVDEVSEIFGEGTVVKEFASWDAASNTIYFKNATTGINHGTPYLIKPGESIDAFMFDDIMVYNDEVAVSSNGVSFQGTLNPVELKESDVFIGTDGVLYRPDTETEGANKMPGFRAYFTGLKSVSGAKLNFDGTATSIDQIATDAQAAGKVYTIDGRYVGNSTKGLAKGLYIAGGKKVVVK